MLHYPHKQWYMSTSTIVVYLRLIFFCCCCYCSAILTTLENYFLSDYVLEKLTKFKHLCPKGNPYCYSLCFLNLNLFPGEQRCPNYFTLKKLNLYHFFYVWLHMIHKISRQKAHFVIWFMKPPISCLPLCSPGPLLGKMRSLFEGNTS